MINQRVRDLLKTFRDLQVADKLGYMHEPEGARAINPSYELAHVLIELADITGIKHPVRTVPVGGRESHYVHERELLNYIENLEGLASLLSEKAAK